MITIINQIEIFNYGKWHRLTLPVRSRLEIYYGRNEAGKTTLLSFVRGVLFGYLPRRTSHKNYIPRQAKNYGGRLKITVGSRQYWLERRSGKHGGQLRLLALNGKQLPLAKFRRLMGPIDRATFNALFYFGNVDLTRVAKMKKRDLVQEIQKVGITHSQFWLDLRQNLIKAAKRVYSPRGYRPILNQKLRQYKQLTGRVRKAKRKYTRYLNLIRDSEEDAQNRKRLRQRWRALERRDRQLRHLRDHWLPIRHLNRLKEVAQKKIQPGFSSSDRQELRRLQENNQKRRNQIAVLKHRFQDIKNDRDNSSQIQLYRGHRSLIQSLADQFSQVSTDLHQQKLQKHYLDQAREDLKRLKPYCTDQGEKLLPLSDRETQDLEKIQDQVHGIDQRIKKLKLQKMRLEAHTGATHHQNSIFKVRKLVPGIGLLVLNLSLIRIQDLKRSKNYSTVKKFYHHPKQLQKKLDYQRGELSNLKRSMIKLGKAHHYSLAASSDRWLSIQTDLRRFQELKRRAGRIRQRLTNLNQALNQYFQRWKFLSNKNVRSNEDRLRRAKLFVQNSERTLQRNQHLQDRLRRIKKALSTVYKQQAANDQQLHHFYRCRQIKDLDGFNQRCQQQVQIKDDQQKYQKLARRLKSPQLINDHQVHDLQTLQLKIHQNDQQKPALDQRLQSIVSQQTAVKTELTQMVQDGSYDRLQQKLANAQTQIIDLARQWLVERLTSEWIDQALDLANHNRVPKIERQARANFYLLTDHHYHNILFNRTRILVLSERGSRFNLHELSKGTLQQLYLAFVFALAEVLGKEFPMPILIDDGFTDFDIHRRRAAWRLLKKLSSKLQIIYCTSDDQVQNWYPVDSLD